MALYHSARGSVNYTVVGNPTIVDGVARGFSTSDYLQTSDILDGSKDVNMIIKCTTGSGSLAGQQLITGTVQLYTHNANNNLRVSVYDTKSSSWKDENLFYLSAETTYYIKIVKNAFGCVISSSTDNVSYTTRYTADIDFRTTDKITFGRTSSKYWSGSIDLNHTYITLNGQPWFGICPIEVQKHQLMGPVGYQISGDGPTVADGWLSGLDGSSSCKTTQTLPAFQTIELMVNVRYPNAVSSSYTPVLGFGTGDNPNKRIIANANTGHGIREDTTEIITIDNNTFNYVTASNQTNGYFIKMTVVKNASDYTYTLSLSLDGQTWASNSANYATNICNDYVSFLRTSTGSATGKPQMNMNISYIKIDNKLWFWQPQPTTKIYVNHVLVWEKSL